MKNILILLISLVCFYNNAHSQTAGRVFVQGNYNFFSMTDLKNFQQELLTDLTDQGIDAKITDSYPGYYGLKAGLLVPVTKYPSKEILVGGFIDFSATGARIHYSDYSGEIKIDQKASAISLGGVVSFCTYEKDFFQLYFDINARFIFSRFKNEITSKLFDQIQQQDLSFTSVSFALEPALVPSINVYPFNFGLAVSYMIALPTTLEYEAYDDANLVNKNGDEIAINWSGFKFGISVKYLF